MSLPAANETIIPVFFGRDADLYGCYHSTADDHQAPTVLICQPTGHEYERCHRAMRQLAVQSARKGLFAMRFDYYATGDSAGDCRELSLSRMQLDTREAIKYCLQKTGVGHLTLVGMRLGATLAAQLAGSCPEIECLVLYAPVFDGKRLLQEWRQAQYEFESKHSQLSHQKGIDEILGFPVSDQILTELEQELAPEEPGPWLQRVLILVDEAEYDSESLNQWVHLLEGRGVAITLETVENIAIWNREPMEAIVPIKPIRRIVNWIVES